MRSQNHLIGKCTFEPTKSRCPISALVFEQCRAWQWAHTVEYNGNKLTKEERELILNLLLSKDKLTFKDIKKALKLSSEVYSFNYKDDDKIVGSYTISKLSKVFDKEWDVMTEQQKEDAWHIIYTATDDEWLTQYAKAKWNFNEKQLKAITSINFKQDYAQLSRKALNNILEFLPDYRYDEAVVLAGVKNAFNKEWNNFDTDKKNEIINAIADIVLNNENYIDYVKEYLKNDYNLSDADLKKLYHHSEKIEKGKRYDKLPVSVDADKEISSLRNPIVTQALFELRNLINNLIDEHGKFDEIKVEMARDLKTSAKVRLETRTKQKQLEVANDEVKKKLEKRNLDLTHDNILKYKLWEECKHICPYTGNEIALSILFTGEIQIEHIVPWSRSLNDSFMNKTLCFADENRAKGDKTPYEYYGNDEHKWEEVKDRAKKLFANPNSYNKFKTFVKQTIDTDFISRQLNDTRYISKEAKNYLEKICANVKVAPGQMTANLRHHWGLNKILSGDDNKTRDDHRHHAVDALVMACFTQNHLQEISKWNRYNRTYEMQAITKPWESFWIDAKTAIDTILVSHKANKRILTTRNHTTEKNGKKHTNTGVAARGQLHKETVYGQHKDVKGETFYHMRKPLEAIDNKAKVGKIADIQIQKLVIQAIEKAGGYIGDKKDKVPPNAFFKSDENGNKIPLVYLKNQNGNPVPIKKVRIKENSSGAVKLKDEINQWVEPGSNHHILIYKNSEGDLCEKVVTFWEAIERKKQKLPIYQLPDNGTEIVTALQINDMFLLGIKEEDINWNNPNHDFLKKYLYRIQKLTSGDYWFRFHLASSLENDLYKQIRGFGNGKTGWFNFNPIKVTVTPTGKIKKLN
ncbi:MAG TPA: type II CRISPR RNA-guided endonuclease Cas9 [Bacteroidia bacterium]|nr:type II CRISPR RNA-guided endonuclease Cas9 [Bacteroidia bacterium]